MTTIDQVGTFPLAGRSVKRLGCGAMQLAGLGVFGPRLPFDFRSRAALEESKLDRIRSLLCIYG